MSGSASSTHRRVNRRVISRSNSPSWHSPQGDRSSRLSTCCCRRRASSEGLRKNVCPRSWPRAAKPKQRSQRSFRGKSLAALYELLRGFVTAHARTESSALIEMARERPSHLYGGLITALMRLVFVLYAEDRGLMPDHPIYQRHYSLGGLILEASRRHRRMARHDGAAVRSVGTATGAVSPYPRRRGARRAWRSSRGGERSSTPTAFRSWKGE